MLRERISLGRVRRARDFVLPYQAALFGDERWSVEPLVDLSLPRPSRKPLDVAVFAARMR